MDDFLMIILKGLVIICTLLIMRYVVPYLRMLLQAQVDANVWKAIIKAVKSVEQDLYIKHGQDKKVEVIKRITGWAQAHGIMITEEEISQLIEAAVWTMNHEDDIAGGM